jgi:hypothetical protein
MDEPNLFENGLESTKLVTVSARNMPKLNVSQKRVFEDLLNVAGERPTASANIGEVLRDRIDAGTRDAVGAWPETTFFLSKSLHSGLGGCEGQVLADYQQRQQSRDRKLPLPAAVGIVAHRAIQISHTHADEAFSPDQLVRLALEGSLEEEGFGTFWSQAAANTQSDVLTRAVSATLGFLDTFPPLASAWAPRFEESVSAKAGGVRLAARMDLVLGRPKPDGRQTMLLADIKTSDVRENHFDEAMFYALIASIRHGVPPYRSTVISVASGEWTDPDVTGDRMFAVADDVVSRVNAGVAVLTEQRPPTLSPSFACSWCSARDTCPAADPLAQSSQPNAVKVKTPQAAANAQPVDATLSEVVDSVESGDDPFAIED